MSATSGASARSAALRLCQAILGLEALAVLFATAYLSGLSIADERGTRAAGPVWAIGLAVAVALVAAAGVQRRPWGRILGWVLQAPMLAAWVVSIPVAVVGLGFVALWIAALRIGGRIDRERSEYLGRAAVSNGAGPGEGGSS